MWVFLATEMLFFGGLFFAYLYGRAHWPEGFAVAGRHTDVLLGTLNTAVLLTSSFAVAVAVAAAEHDRRRWVARLLLADRGARRRLPRHQGHRIPARLGRAPVPRHRLRARRRRRGAELFFVLYFLTTGLHAVHLTIGIVLMASLRRGHRARERLGAPRRGCRSPASTGTSSTWSGSSSTRSSTSSSVTREQDRRQPTGRTSAPSSAA